MGARTLLVAQSGGPTAVINASLAGVIEAASRSGQVGAILGARNGVEGILGHEFTDLSAINGDRLERLRRTPSAALGTSRHRPTDDEVGRILDIIRQRQIDIFITIGGNDTADTAMRLANAARESGDAPRVVAVPKTIDNDLPETDHCPGYGSIARFVALAVRDAAFDTRAMRHIYPIKIVEVMGRNAGWLAAAGALAFDEPLPRPIICLPERPLADLASLADLVNMRVQRDGYAVLVVPETLKWAGGSPVGGDTPVWVDTFGHRYFPSVADALSRQLTTALGLRARYDKPGTIARMAMHATSEVDLTEAWQVGQEAVRRALDGETGVMVTIERVSSDPYQVTYHTAPLERIANIERLLPATMIADSGYDVTDTFLSYARPLIGAPLPKYEVLD